MFLLLHLHQRKLLHSLQMIYLIDDKLYKIKKDKSLGKLFGTYINGKIIEN